ncbi:MFS general substrate transporter [Amniculicola lignicola CBS 123094]|uniref:MFS general substrate transporter n=1 Tax=Amniculicola lignicola CBS 123094 TaxID=1392246 RepID=A0A6A5X3T2_9PLEO|nr:MFS general substrate transporter [Amniculicola lignicola CBS 123094]
MVEHESIKAAPTHQEHYDEKNYALDHTLTNEIHGFEADYEGLRKGYYTSPFFLGTFLAVGLAIMCGTGAFGYAWISLVYNAVLAVFLSPVGRLSDIFGRRYFFVGGGVVGIIGSIVCATAKDIPTLIGGNVLLAAATATQLSFHFVIGELVPMKYRYSAIGLIYAFTYASSGMGPAISASFIAHTSVGWLYPWKSTAVICAITIGFVTLVVFVLWEIYAPIKEPLIPMHLFLNGRWVAAVVLLGLGAGVYYAFSIVWPAQAAVLYGNGDTMRTGYMSTIVGIGIITGQIAAGILATKIGKTRYQCMAVFIIGGIFLGCAAVAEVDNMNTTIALIFMGCFFIGWNESICLANSTILVRDQREIGVAGGTAGSVRAAICAVMVAVFTTVMSNRLTTEIPRQVPPALIEAGLPASSVPAFLAAIPLGADAIAAVPGITNQIFATGYRAYQDANADAFRTVYFATIAFTGLSIVLTWWAPNTDDLMSGKVAATLHHEGQQDGKLEETPSV